MKEYIRFVGRYWALLLFGFLAVFWGNLGQSFVISWFGAGIQQSLGLSASFYGFAYSLATMLSALTVVWLGGLIDRFSLRLYTTAVCLGLVVAALIMWQANHWLILLVGFYGLRLFGQALFPHTGATTMARVFVAHRGKAISIASSGVPLGEVVLPALAVFFIHWLGWQTTYLAAALWLLLIVLPVMLLLISYSKIDVTDREQKAANKAAVPQGARRVLLTDFRYWRALPGLMAGPFVVTGIFIQQNFVLAEKNWTPEWFATCFIIYGVCHWLTAMITGVLVDRFRAVRLLPFFPLPMLVALVVLAVVPGQFVAPVFMALLAMSVGSSPVITGSLWPEIYGTHAIGAIRSINIAVMVFATALSPVLYGLFIDWGVSLAWLMGGNALYVAIAMVLLGWSYTAHPHQYIP